LERSVARLSKETSIYNTDAIAQGIEDAENAYKTVVEVDANGIRLHPAEQSGSGIVDYTQIDTTGVKLYKGGTQIASFGDSATIGKANGPHTVIQSSGVDFYGASDGSVNLVHIGYASGNAQSGTATAPYYTLGKRKTTTDVYSASSTYSKGDHVLYGGVEYVCTTAITSPETWNPSHWTRAIGNYSHAEGYDTTASGYNSHVEGEWTVASGIDSHAEGAYTEATNEMSHAEGFETEASGYASHAEGEGTHATGTRSHAQNNGTKAQYADQTAIGRSNNNQSDNAFEIGNGTGSAPSNAFAVTWDGEVWMKNPSKTRTNLGLGGLATKSAVSNSVTFVDCSLTNQTFTKDTNTSKTLKATVPSGYVVCGLGRISTNHSSALLLTEFDLNADGSLSVTFHNRTQTTYTDVNINAQILCLKTSIS